MNNDYEVFCESIAKELNRRQQVLQRIGVENPPEVIEWDDFPEEARETFISVVRSLIEDGFIIPGTEYIKPDPYEAYKVLKEKLESEDENR